MDKKVCTQPHSTAPRLLYDRKEAARQLSVSMRSLDYLIANKQLSFRRIGKKVLVPHAELVRFARGDHFGPVNGRQPGE
jgi:excisionase family DNA binding protein